MDQPKEELEQIATWFIEEGLAPDSPKEAQLYLLWSSLQRTRSRLNSVTWDLDTQRSQHLSEMAEVRKSLEQIRIFTEHKDVLAQEIQDENDQLKDQLRRLISLQDSQISEVAKMLYQQGLTELIHSSPSEQVAYLLVERASLLEITENPNNLTGDGNTATALGTEAQALNTIAHQSSHKGAPRHGQSPWKRLFGLHKAAQSKHTFIPVEARHLTGQASSVARECSRLERDLEEGSRRLAMAHNEIRRMTDELESAHLTQRAYEPELQAAQQEVEQLRQEVHKLKKYEMVELRKAKELNDRLDLEIRALRSRVRTLDAEKSSLIPAGIMVVSLQEKVERLESALQQQQQQLTVQVQDNRAADPAEPQAAELAQSNHTCRYLQEELTAQTTLLCEKQETRGKWVAGSRQAGGQEARDPVAQKPPQAAELAQSNHTCRYLQEELTAQTRLLCEKQETRGKWVAGSRQAGGQEARDPVAQKPPQAAELAQSNHTCRYLQEELTAQTRLLCEKQETRGKWVAGSRQAGGQEARDPVAQKPPQAAELAQSNHTCRYLQEELTAQTTLLCEKQETREVGRLESALQEQQQQVMRVQANQANELAKAIKLNKSNESCRDLQNKLSAQSRCLLEKQSEIHSLKQQLETSPNDLDTPFDTICTKEHNLQDQKLWKQKDADSQHFENPHGRVKDDKEPQTQLLHNKENTLRKECPDLQEAVKTLLATQDECETLKKEICETLKCLDQERSKKHEMKEKHKTKLCRAKQKYDDETTWRDEKIKSLERELSLCSHSVAKEKQLTVSITVENEKLLVERRRLLQQLNEEEHNKKDSNLKGSLSKCRVDFLEMENEKLGKKILHMSNQLAFLERSLQNMQSLHFAEVTGTELKKTCHFMKLLKPFPVQTSSVKMPEPSEIQALLDNTEGKQTDVTWSPHCLVSGPLSRSAEMGYLNLSSAQRRSDRSAHPPPLSSSDSTCS
ncbi:coiled-coil domain-containing protein 30 isoform X3 [Cottoperca gobio]|uniref:Coiled-coil domain-containing protein 30 isoform X3 n=1 Tax=Cottoperca gobio TaxID=56716 RepID=A0A6J2PMR5_COTGO|nr:coiled-coil domain-containing protein 30-like isoform X3 [Cottoperca gobio]